LLALLVSSYIIQVHGQAADWAREAGWHHFNEINRLIWETGRHNGRFVDASSSVWAGELV
jgi:hypothetical protein